MLPVSKDTHFTHSQKQMGAPHSHHGFLAYIWSAIPVSLFGYSFLSFSNSATLSLSFFSYSLFPLSCPFTFSPSFFLPPSSILHNTFYILFFISTPNILSPLFMFCCNSRSVFQPDLIPPFCCPFFPTCHAHLCVCCMFCDSQTIFFFLGPSNTRIA